MWKEVTPTSCAFSPTLPESMQHKDNTDTGAESSDKTEELEKKEEVEKKEELDDQCEDDEFTCLDYIAAFGKAEENEAELQDDVNDGGFHEDDMPFKEEVPMESDKLWNETKEEEKVGFQEDETLEPLEKEEGADNPARPAHPDPGDEPETGPNSEYARAKRMERAIMRQISERTGWSKRSLQAMAGMRKRQRGGRPLAR